MNGFFGANILQRRRAFVALLALLFLTATTGAFAQLSGTYTIGTSGSENYSSIDNAISALSSGVSGPVVFEISSGSYTSYGYYLIPVSGMSSTNTVTFRPAAGATVQISGAVGYDGIFHVYGGSHFIIDGNSSSGAVVTRGLTIVNSVPTSYCAAIMISDGASYNIIRNSKLQANSDYNLSSSSGGAVVEITSSYSGSGNDSNVIDNNIVGDPTGTNRTPAGVFVYGNSSYPSHGNRVTNNTIVNFGQGTSSTYYYSGYGVRIGYAPGTLVRGNEITSTTPALTMYLYGVYIDNSYGYCPNARIDGNSIHGVSGTQSYGADQFYAIYSYVYNDQNDSLVICNNMLSLTRSGQDIYGLFVDSPYYTVNSHAAIVNNSVYVSTADYLELVPIWVYDMGPMSFEITNNIFKVSGVSYGYFYDFYWDPSNVPAINCDYSVYDLSGSLNFYYGYNYYSDRASWDAGSGSDQHSYSGDPHFIAPSTGNLHVDTVMVSLLESRGTPHSYVTTDIDGDPRSAGYPDIGADEGNFNGGGIHVISPNGGEQVTVDYQLPVVMDLTRPLTVRIELSTDNGASWTMMGTFDNLVGGRVADTITTPDVETNSARVRITSALNANERDTSDRVFSLVRPIITVVGPNGGEMLVPTDTVALRWSSKYLPPTLRVDLEYSIDGGSNWIQIDPAASSPNLPAINSYPWIVPNTPTSDALFRAVIVGSSIGDTSDRVFTILPKPGVTLLSPNGGEGVFAGSTWTIRWNSITVDNVKVEYSTDGGTTWKSALQGGIRYVPAYLGEYPWAVPDAETSTALVRVTSVERPRFSDVSDAEFSIVKSDLSILTPVGGSSYALAQPVTVSWVSRNVQTLKVEYSADGGGNWITVNSSVDATVNSSLLFTPPAVPTKTALVRITSIDRPDLSSSSGLFEIVSAPSIRIYSPVAGDRLIAGSTHEISFETSGIPNVDIYFSSNNGTSWALIASGVPAWRGTYEWNLPTATTSNARIRINQTGGSISVESGLFSIVSAPAPKVTVIAPNGGERYTVGDPITIRWSAVDVDLVTISWSSDNGATWNTIAANVPANQGSISWTAPDTPSSRYLVRVQGAGASDQSNATFTINPKPQPAITVIYPNGNESFMVGDTAMIRWSSQAVPGNVDLEFSADSGQSWIPIGSASAASIQLAWPIPDIATSQGLIRITDPASGVRDISDGSFSIARPLVTSLRVITPNRSTDIWQEGTTATVRWVASNVMQINIRVSIDGGTTFRDLAQAVDATLGTWSWQVDHMSADTLRSLVVRIVDATDPSIFDDSDQPFEFLPAGISLVGTNAVTGGGMELIGNFPNPFGTRTEIRWNQPWAGAASLRIYSATGTRVTEEDLGNRAAGEQRAALSAGELPAGSYLYEINSAHGSVRGVMVIVR